MALVYVVTLAVLLLIAFSVSLVIRERLQEKQLSREIELAIRNVNK